MAWGQITAPSGAGGMAAFIINSSLVPSCTPTSLPPNNPYFLNGVIRFYLCQGAVMRFQWNKGQGVLETFRCQAHVKKMWITQSCPTLCNSMDCSLLDSSVLGILQARILEWVAIPFSRGSSQPRDANLLFIAGRFFTLWVTMEAPDYRRHHWTEAAVTAIQFNTWIHLPLHQVFNGFGS